MKLLIRFILIILLTLNLTALPANASAELIDLPKIATLEMNGSINTAAFSKDDKYIATGDSEGFISIWNASTGTSVTKWKASKKNGAVTKVLYSPDGKKIASVSNGELSIWDVATSYQDRILTNEVAGSIKDVNDILFNKDGTFLYAAYDNSTVIYWNVQTGDKFPDISPGNATRSLAYNPIANHLAIGLSDGSVAIYDSTTRTSIGIVSQAISQSITKLNYAADYTHLFGSSVTGEKVVLDARKGYSKVAQETTDYASSGAWKDFHFSQNGKYIAVKDEAFTGILDTTTKQIVSQTTDAAHNVVRFSHDNKRLLAANFIYDTSVLPYQQLLTITIQPETSYMMPNDSQTLTVSGTFNDSTKQTIPLSEVKLTSSKPAVATFSYGKLEAIAPGETTITAEYKGIKTTVVIQVKSFKTLPTKLDKPATKSWDVKFSADVEFDTVIEKNIYITDRNNSIVPVNYYTTGNLIRLAPVTPYSPGQTYTVWVKDIKSKSGSSLKEFTKMDFTIQK